MLRHFWRHRQGSLWRLAPDVGISEIVDAESLQFFGCGVHFRDGDLHPLVIWPPVEKIASEVVGSVFLGWNDFRPLF